MKGYFIVCEGMDRAGKTTSIKESIKYIEKDYQVEYNKGLKTQTLFGKFSSRYPSTFSLILEQLYSTYFRIKPSLGKGKIVLQDRYFYTIFSHNPENKKDKLLEKLFTPFFEKPDLMVYFKVSPEERMRRLKQEHAEEHAELIANPKIIEERDKRLLKYFERFEGKKVKIDTTGSLEKESGYKLYKIIESELFSA